MSQTQPKLSSLENAANQLMQQGEWMKAQHLWQQLHQQNPQDSNSLFQLAITQHQLGNMPNALQCLNQLVKQHPEHKDGWDMLGTVLRAMNKMSLALDCYKRLIQIDPASRSAHISLPILLHAMGETEEVQRYYEIGLKKFPYDATLLYNMVETLPTEYWHGEIEQKLLTALKELRDENDHIALCYALAKYYWKKKQYDRSFEYYQTANKVHLQHRPFDWEQYQRCYTDFYTALPPEALESLPQDGLADATPIFIVGMPRSGTSLIEQILASHSQVDGAGELRFMPYIAQIYLPSITNTPYPFAISKMNEQMSHVLSAHYLKTLREYQQRPNVTRIIDKLPHNHLNIPLIRRILPQAKIIICEREPVDNCWSIWSHYFPDGHNYKCKMEHLAATYQHYTKLMDYFRSHLPSKYIYTQNYEALLDAPEEQIRELLAFCDLEWEPECMEFHHNKRSVNTASVNQVRQPLNRKGLKRWKPVEEQLTPLIEGLQKNK